MKKANISGNVVRRLPRYIRTLNDLMRADVGRVSSAELGRLMGLTPSQIRQDFSCFGEFGQQGYGYNVELLHEQISGILGIGRDYSVIVVGIGNLGHALIENFGFAMHGFHVVGAFDVARDLVGKEVGGITIQSGSNMADFIRENHVDIAVLAVSHVTAPSVARILVDNGIKAIWNFTNVDLGLSGQEDVIVEDIHFSDSLLALSYYLTEKLDGEAAKADGGKA